MAASNSVLERYALAYIKKSGNSSNVKEFLQFCNGPSIGNLTWSKQNFEEIYDQYNTQAGYALGTGGRQQRNKDGDAQFNNAHRQSASWSFWDYLLLQCCIDSLLGGRSNTTVNNVTNVNYGSSHSQNSTDKRKEEADGRRLLALGIAATVVVIIFHVSMCYLYHNNRKTARKSDKIDYLDNKLKTFRNIEFASCAVSLIALITCAVYPVLPIWGLVILGIHSLACFAGGLAFHMKHGEESENIDKARKAVQNYTNQNLGPNYQAYSTLGFSHSGAPHDAPPPYSPQDPNRSTPSASYDNQGSDGTFNAQQTDHSAAQRPSAPSADDNPSFVDDSGLYPNVVHNQFSNPNVAGFSSPYKS